MDLLTPSFSLSEETRNFLNVLIPESKTSSHVKTSNPVPKLGDLYRNHLGLFFQQGKEKHSSVIQCRDIGKYCHKPWKRGCRAFHSSGGRGWHGSSEAPHEVHRTDVWEHPHSDEWRQALLVVGFVQLNY